MEQEKGCEWFLPSNYHNLKLSKKNSKRKSNKFTYKSIHRFYDIKTLEYTGTIKCSNVFNRVRTNSQLRNVLNYDQLRIQKFMGCN